jgi:hypothetical protein
MVISFAWWAQKPCAPITRHGSHGSQRSNALEQGTFVAAWPHRGEPEIHERVGEPGSYRRPRVASLVRCPVRLGDLWLCHPPHRSGCVEERAWRVELGETGPVTVFLDRVDAGRHLAAAMRHRTSTPISRWCWGYRVAVSPWRPRYRRRWVLRWTCSWWESSVFPASRILSWAPSARTRSPSSMTMS